MSQQVMQLYLIGLLLPQVPQMQIMEIAIAYKMEDKILLGIIVFLVEQDVLMRHQQIVENLIQQLVDQLNLVVNMQYAHINLTIILTLP